MDIRVKLSRGDNAEAWGIAGGEVVTMSLEQYLCGVVGAEMGANAPPEALKAQAIAARTYALPYVSGNKVITDDSSVNQAYEAVRAHWPEAEAAVQATLGLVLTWQGKVLKTCPFSASNGGRTVDSGERWQQALPYLIAREDPWDTAEQAYRNQNNLSIRKGHGVGMSQYGAMYAARAGIACADILAFYYPGTEITTHYGNGGMEKMVEKPKMGTCIMTRNDCYKAGRAMKPAGIVVHSTGCNNPTLKRYVGPDDGVLGKNLYGNHWNQPDFKKCVHAFIGKAADGTVMAYQTLPWTMQGWGVGSGKKGSYNASHIQFEMCEDGLTSESYFRAVRGQAVRLCAWLCQQYSVPVGNVVGHYEAHAAGYANNHGDPRNWMPKFGDGMDAFRADVQKLIEGGSAPEDGNETEGEEDMEHYIGTVQTRYDGKISLWNDTKKSKRLCYVNDGERVEVLGAIVVGTMAPATAQDQVGFVDTQYLVDRQYIQKPGEDTSEIVIDGPAIVIRSTHLAEFLEALRKAEIIGLDREDASDA